MMTAHPGTVLFVCAANVCRSPLMLFRFQQTLRDSGGAELWTASSGGVLAAEGDAVCQTVSSYMGGSAEAIAFAARHRSTQLTPDTIRGADLIITASREERSAVARLAIESRTKTFTLLEAAALASHASASGLLFADGRDNSAALFTATLNAHRGRILAPPARSRALRKDAGAYFDVADAHRGKARHRDVRDLINRSTATLVGTMLPAAARGDRRFRRGLDGLR